MVLVTNYFGGSGFEIPVDGSLKILKISGRVKAES